MTGSKALEMTLGQAAKPRAVVAFMVEEYQRVGYFQCDEDATTYHRQRLATLVRAASQEGL